MTPGQPPAPAPFRGAAWTGFGVLRILRPALPWLVPLFLLGGCASGPNRPALPPAYHRAVRLQRAGEAAAAVDAYRLAVAQCNLDRAMCRQCRLLLGEALENAGRPREALKTFAALAAWTGHAATAARANVRAAHLLETALGRPDRALTLHLRTIAAFPAEVAAEDALQRVLRLHPAVRGQGRAGLVRLLMDLYSRLSDTPMADDILFAAANVYARGGHAARALALHDRLWASFPRSPLWDDSLWKAAKILESQGRFEAALARYQRLASTRRDAFLLGSENSVLVDDAQLRIGILRLERLGDPRGAVAAFERLVSDFDTSTLRDDALWWIARARFRSGETRSA